jgi:hypothetical protein
MQSARFFQAPTGGGGRGNRLKTWLLAARTAFSEFFTPLFDNSEIPFRLKLINHHRREALFAFGVGVDEHDVEPAGFFVVG